MINDNIMIKNFYKFFFNIQNISSTLFIKYNSSIFLKNPNLLVLIA